MHTIYLMSVDWDQRAAASRAVYNVQRALGHGRYSHTKAYDLVRRCHEGTPMLVGTAGSDGLLALARKPLDDAGDALVYAVDPSPEEVFNPQPKLEAVPELPSVDEPAVAESAGNNVFEPEVYETAMMLIVAMHGNPFAALSVAAGLARTTRSDSFTRVGKCILRVFPPESAQAGALVAQVLGEHGA